MAEPEEHWRIYALMFALRALILSQGAVVKFGSLFIALTEELVKAKRLGVGIEKVEGRDK